MNSGKAKNKTQDKKMCNAQAYQLIIINYQHKNSCLWVKRCELHLRKISAKVINKY